MYDQRKKNRTCHNSQTTRPNWAVCEEKYSYMPIRFQQKYIGTKIIRNNLVRNGYAFPFFSDINIQKNLRNVLQNITDKHKIGWEQNPCYRKWDESCSTMTRTTKNWKGHSGNSEFPKWPFQLFVVHKSATKQICICSWYYDSRIQSRNNSKFWLATWSKHEYSQSFWW